jgi:hypothetical protein
LINCFCRARKKIVTGTIINAAAARSHDDPKQHISAPEGEFGEHKSCYGTGEKHDKGIRIIRTNTAPTKIQKRVNSDFFLSP